MTLTGADTDEMTTGNGVARGSARTLGAFINPETLHDDVVETSEGELPDQHGTLVLVTNIDVPETGQLGVGSYINADARADGSGNSAATTSTVDITDIVIERIG